MTADVFISYSREDKDRVTELATKLREAGVSLWIDQGGIDAAAIWTEEIVNALENAKVLLLMISEKAVNSHNVLKEVTIASERKGHILPIHLEPTKIPAAMKYALAGIQHVEYFHGDQSENIKTIVRSLERIGVSVVPPKKEAAPQSPTTVATGAMMDVPESGMAVLPFENSSPDPDADYFSDGLTDELIASLSKVGELGVVSRLTSVQYKNTKKDARTIGQELQARYIVTGNVRKFQDNLRITAQLVDAKSNKQLWAETYKGKLDDIFDIQEQVAKQIAEALKLKLSISEKVVLSKRPTLNAQAYDLFLRGREYLYQLTKRSVEYSIQLFEKAIELDPRYAGAYAACSNAYGLLYYLFTREDRIKDVAQELGLKALMYDSNSAEAYAALSLSYTYQKMYDEAIAAGKKAIELDPDHFLPYWIVGRIYYSIGNYVEAKELFEKTIVKQQDFYAAHRDLELTYEALGERQKALVVKQKLLDLFPTYLLRFPEDSRARMIYAVELAGVGREAEAKTEGKRASELSPGDALMLYNAACLFSQLGDVRLSVSTLKEAIEAGHENFDWIKRDSDLDPIRNDPEYIELMKDK
ncbi:MAG: TIR domain-containing protein [Candidatus Kapaibacterium sp.]